MKKKVAFVTASNIGIGKSIVKSLLKNGYIVYSNGRAEKKLSFKDVKYISADMTDKDSIQKSLNTIYKTESRLDLVVANLGSGKSVSGYDISIDEYKRVFDINFFSSVSIATLACKYLKKTNGNIIFISSIAGCESISAPIAYASAKTALLSFAKALSSDVAKLGIRVNSISPGNVMFKESTWDQKIKKDKKKVLKYIYENVALNKFVKPKDITKAVLFLEKSKSITGSNIVVDGGQINKII